MPAANADAPEAGMSRSYLFVPADSERKIAKALETRADTLILDLEDSVAAAAKPKARALAAEALGGTRRKPLYVRVNAFDTGLTAADLEAVLPARPDGLMLPKCNSGADVARLAGLAPLPVIVLATETAASIFHLGTYAGASPLLRGLTWGMEDLATALGAQANRDAAGVPTDPYRLARTLCLFAARAADVQPIDAVYPNFRDLAGLERICAEAVRDGFTGKLCIHPDQVDVINRAFTPSVEAIARARRIVEAFAASGDAGVIAMDGEMLDVPHLQAAKALLARAAAQ
jgi:citrate lyase subunit beta / citryl-CoA lyase